MAIEDLCYKNAIIYFLDVETFMDANGEGVGDFAGLSGRLDYLAGLGVTCVWLQPFYASPNQDNGYDVKMLNFPVTQRLFYALGTADLPILRAVIRETAPGSLTGRNGVQFLRSHDEWIWAA